MLTLIDRDNVSVTVAIPRSGWASMAPRAGSAPRPPWSCIMSVREGSQGQMHTCKGPAASCVPARLCWVFPRSGSKTTGNEKSLGMRIGLPVRVRNVPKSAGPSGDGDSTLWGAQLLTARRLPGWASPECEWREATSDASDSRQEGGGRVVTCDASVNYLFGWCTQRSQCCPCRTVRARPVSGSWDGSRPGVQPATLGSWRASAAGDPSKPLTLQARWTWPPSPWRRHPC